MKFIAILNLVFLLILCFFFAPFLFWSDIFFLHLCPRIFSFCERIVWFWFVVSLFFKYVNSFLHLLALAWELKHTLKKRKSLDFLTFLPYILWFWWLFFNIFMFILLLFLVFTIAFTIGFPPPPFRPVYWLI